MMGCVFLVLSWIFSLLFGLLAISMFLTGNWPQAIPLVGLVLLLSTMLPFISKEVNGARLWLVLGPLRFQPSELAKIFLAIFFAAYLADKRELISAAGRSVIGFRLPRLRDLGPLLTMWAISLLLLIFQKDLGSSLLFFGINNPYKKSYTAVL